MRSIVCGALGAALLGLLGCSSPAPSEPTLGSSASRIVHGQQDTTHQAVMYLQYQKPGSTTGAACSGTLVAVQGTYGYLLTAAHCVLGEAGKPLNATASNFTVVQGNDVNSGSAIAYPVVDFKADPSNNVLTAGTNTPLVYDFAVVKFNGVGGSTPAPIPMLTAALDDLQAGSAVEVVGYGILSGGGGQNTQRMYADNNLADISQYGIAAVTSLTVAYSEAGSLGGACSGDSGGPVLHTVGGTQYVAAVTSYGDQYCTSFGVSGRVSAAVDQFINGYISGSGGGTQTCAQCEQASTSGAGSCMSTVTACQNDTDCSALLTCLNACAAGDTACFSSCGTAHPTGTKVYQKIGDCICKTGCATECASDALCQAPACGFTFSDQTCGTCVDGACCSSEQACADDSACTACVTTTTPDPSCSSNALVKALQSCITSSCNTQCGGGGTGGAGGGGGGGAGAGGAAGSGTGGAAGTGTGGAAGTGTGGLGGAGGETGGVAGAGGSGQGTGDSSGNPTSGSTGSCSVPAPGSRGGNATFALVGLAALFAAGRRRRSS